MEGGGDDLAQSLGIGRPEFGEAIAGPEVEQLRQAPFASEDGAFGMTVPAVGTALEDAFKQAFLWEGEPFGSAEDGAEWGAPGLLGAFEELSELERGGWVGVEVIGLEGFDLFEVFGQSFGGEMVGGEDEPVAGGIKGMNPAGRVWAGDLAADENQPITGAITNAPPHGLEESLFLGEADAALEVETDRHTGGTASGAISIKSKPPASAMANASRMGLTPTISPFSLINRTSGARICALTRVNCFWLMRRSSFPMKKGWPDAIL